jgi:hypothetical protein
MPTPNTWDEHLRRAQEERLRREQREEAEAARLAAEREARGAEQRREREQRNAEVRDRFVELQKAIATLRSVSGADGWTFSISPSEHFDISRGGAIWMRSSFSSYHNRALEDVVEEGHSISPGLIDALLKSIASALANERIPSVYWGRR